jgi:hypothetical protein
MFSDWEPETSAHTASTNQKNQVSRAEVIGSDTCIACGIKVRSYTPVLVMCRRLLAAGYGGEQVLHVYRDGVLALTVASIAQGESLEINTKGTGFTRFRAVRTASQVRQFGGGGG